MDFCLRGEGRIVTAWKGLDQLVHIVISEKLGAASCSIVGIVFDKILKPAARLAQLFGGLVYGQNVSHLCFVAFKTANPTEYWPLTVNNRMAYLNGSMPWCCSRWHFPQRGSVQ
jgi:hypothetical protein